VFSWIPAFTGMTPLAVINVALHIRGEIICLSQR